MRRYKLVNEYGVFKANSPSEVQNRAATRIQEFLLEYGENGTLTPDEAKNKAWDIVKSSSVEAYSPSLMGICRHQLSCIGRFVRRNTFQRNLKPLSHRPNSAHESQSYWRRPTSPGNLPQGYLDVGKTAHTKLRSQFLLRTIKELGFATDSKILEIGCSSGRNLHYLFNGGYANLEGVEINEDAIELFHKAYPEAARHVLIHNAPVEKTIPGFENKSFDIVFTMDTLEVLHKESDWIFPHLVRITRKTLITVENEAGRALIYTPRNYKTIFEALGTKQIKELRCGDSEGYPRALMDPSDRFVARVFTMPQ